MHGVWKSQKKVSFNIASEASYVYILSRQKLIKNAKNGRFGEFWKLEACSQTVLPDRSVLIGQKSVKIAKIQKFKCDIWVTFKQCEFDEQVTYLDDISRLTELLNIGT